MDLLDAAAEFASDVLKRGEAVSVVLAGAVVYLIRAKGKADERAEHRTDQAIAVIDETNKALAPIGAAMVAAHDTIKRVEDQNEELLKQSQQNGSDIRLLIDRGNRGGGR